MFKSLITIVLILSSMSSFINEDKKTCLNLYKDAGFNLYTITMKIINTGDVKLIEEFKTDLDRLLSECHNYEGMQLYYCSNHIYSVIESIYKAFESLSKKDIFSVVHYLNQAYTKFWKSKKSCFYNNEKFRLLNRYMIN